MTDAERASIEQIRAELEKEGKSFRELPKFAEYIEARQRYQGEELQKQIRAINFDFQKNNPGYAMNAAGQVIGLLLDRTLIKDLTPLAALTHLQWLEVSKTPISDLTPLATLTHLQMLFVDNTQVSNLTPLAALTQLQALFVSGTPVSDLAPLAALTQLQWLKISDTLISDLTPLAALTQLQTLNAYFCEIRVLPRALVERLEIIGLDGNPLERPPLEIVQQGKAAMLAWLDANEEERPLNEAKALLVGDGGAGKTSLVKQLFGEAFDPHEGQTHGIRIRDWKMNERDITLLFKQLLDEAFDMHEILTLGIRFRDWKMDKRDITVHLWDFGGQEIMHATHQFFLSKRSLYILVLDGRKEEKTEYWLKHIATFGGASPVVIVINKIDENPGFDENRKDLLRKYPNIKGFYRVSCKSGAGIGDFRRELRGHLAQVEHLSTRWGEEWFSVKTQLEQMEKPYIAYEQYAQMCEAAQIADETSQTVLADFLHDLGIALHFHDPILKETNVINPRWATEGVYAIINAPQLAANNGLLRAAALCEILDCQRYPRRKHDYLVELMKKFELCYQVSDDDTLLVPDLLSKDEPDFPFDEAAALRFRFEYDFLPRSVMPRFIVKMHRDILGDLRWRTGVVLRDSAFRATAVVRVDHEARAISMAVSGERKRDYFAVLRKTLRDLHATFETLDVKEMAPLPDHPDIAIEYEELLGCEQMKMTEYTVGKLRKRYNVTELLNGIEAAEERNSDELRRRIEDLQRKRRYLEQKRDDTRSGIGVLDLPDDFRRELTDFLTTLPSISQQNGRAAFLINAALEDDLKKQILIEQAPAHFVPHLIDAACKFGASDGARHPLEMILEAAKDGISQNRGQHADEMIFHIRALVRAAKSAARYAVETELTGVENDLRRLETQLRLLDGRIL